MTKKNIFFIIFPVVVLGLAFFIYYYPFSLKNVSELIPDREQKPSVEDTQWVLLKKSKIVFPQIKSTEVVGLDNLPKEIKDLVTGEASSMLSPSASYGASRDIRYEVERLKYENNNNGFKVKYIESEPLDKSYYKFLDSNPSWQLLFGSRGFAASLIEKEIGNFQIRISQSRLSEKSNEVIIQTVSK